MWFRVLTEFEFHDQMGKAVVLHPGQLVDVLNRHEARTLLRKGVIIPKELSTSQADKRLLISPVIPGGRRRLLCWFPMKKFYSGGRVHLTQFAWNLAQLGNHVTVATDSTPPWWNDYPALDNLVLWDTSKDSPSIIPDFDLVVVDGKNAVARQGLQYAREHGVPFVAWNFETPNWFTQFRPDVAKLIAYHDDYKDVFRAADLMLATSDESAAFLRLWLDDKDAPLEVINPAVNETALEGGKVPKGLQGRKFIVSCGRGSGYKNDQLACDVVFAYGKQMDWVKVGRLNGGPNAIPGPLHKVHHFPNVSDRVKFALMREAVAVLAPSDFEGFGMVPAEALAVRTPVIVYDLPVLRQEYGDALTYVERGNKQAYTIAAHSVLSAPKKHVVSKRKQGAILKTLGMAAQREAIDDLPYFCSSKPRISAVMNAYACAKVVPFALEAVYPHVHEIIISYGREQAWPWPEDNTLEVLRNFPDPDGKIQIIAKDVWPGTDGKACRQAMRDAAVERITGNYLMILDSDEIWTGFENYVAALGKGTIDGGCPLAVTFWHDLGHHIVSSGLYRWGEEVKPYGAVWPHVRILPWRASHYWHSHIVPYAAASKKIAWASHNNRKTVEALGTTCVLYHMGHCMPREFMTLKKGYYKQRDKHVQQADAWLRWKGQIGDCGDGIVRGVDWTVPDIVSRAYKAIHDES